MLLNLVEFVGEKVGFEPETALFLPLLAGPLMLIVGSPSWVEHVPPLARPPFLVDSSVDHLGQCHFTLQTQTPLEVGRVKCLACRPSRNP